MANLSCQSLLSRSIFFIFLTAAAPNGLPFQHLLMISRRARQPQHKIDNNSRKQANRQHSGPKAIIEPLLAPHPYTPRPPMELIQRINHGAHGNNRENGRADLPDFVAEVEQPDGKTAEDDGEVEPGEEGAFVGEEDFGLDAGGEGDAFA